MNETLNLGYNVHANGQASGVMALQEICLYPAGSF